MHHVLYKMALVCTHTALKLYTHMCLVVDYISHLCTKDHFLKRVHFKSVLPTWIGQKVPILAILWPNNEIKVIQGLAWWRNGDLKYGLSESWNSIGNGKLNLRIYHFVKYLLIKLCWYWKYNFQNFVIFEKRKILNLVNWQFLKFRPIRFTIFRNWAHFTLANEQLWKIFANFV